jgi:Arc/MetJ-type ribon-helix-helix transcriptional regulator
MERMVSFRMREADYQALMRLVASDLYASPSHAMRRAITLLLAMHGVMAIDTEAVA